MEAGAVVNIGIRGCIDGGNVFGAFGFLAILFAQMLWAGLIRIVGDGAVDIEGIPLVTELIGEGPAGIDFFHTNQLAMAMLVQTGHARTFPLCEGSYLAVQLLAARAGVGAGSNPLIARSWARGEYDG